MKPKLYSLIISLLIISCHSNENADSKLFTDKISSALINYGARMHEQVQIHNINVLKIDSITELHLDTLRRVQLVKMMKYCNEKTQLLSNAVENYDRMRNSYEKSNDTALYNKVSAKADEAINEYNKYVDSFDCLRSLDSFLINKKYTSSSKNIYRVNARINLTYIFHDAITNEDETRNYYFDKHKNIIAINEEIFDYVNKRLQRKTN